MALRLLLVMAVLLFCLATQVSSDSNIQDHETQVALKAKRVHKGMRYLLREVQVCSSGYLRQPRGLWKVLH
ncbi:gibberellin-regulated protein 11-like [Prunus yedoensis var. nudiflora]|uniref:Gibberellin-regulated protein 11-like n=1 Tax=Prunus yedoensis var. nudiflora TaxID=2094558 RepID=A0A314YXA8_PRUYE|nr:gibberellin-regulated protein 11-like [Prunus yedoensis var. nudiflora]